MSPEWAMLAASVVLAIITLWYATETRRMAGEMKRQTQALVSARVVVYPAKRGDLVLMVVENVGASLAEDVRITVDRLVPVNDLGARVRLSDDRMFSGRPTSLSPGERRETQIGTERFVFKEAYNDYASPFTVSLSYSSAGSAETVTLPICVLDLWSFTEHNNLIRVDHLRQECE